MAIIYDDLGVMGRYHPDDEDDWRATEPYCFNCGHTTDNCDCGDYRCGTWFDPITLEEHKWTPPKSKKQTKKKLRIINPEPEPMKPKQEYKCITALYEPREQYFKIPEEWDVKDIIVKWGKLFYKGECQDVPEEESEGDRKYPQQINEEDIGDVPFWKDE